MKASAILFGGSLEGVSEEVFGDVVGEVPTTEFEKARLASPGIALPERAGSRQASALRRGQARKDIDGGGIYVNNERVAEAARLITASDLLFGKYCCCERASAPTPC